MEMTYTPPIPVSEDSDDNRVDFEEEAVSLVFIDQRHQVHIIAKQYFFTVYPAF